MTNKYLNKDYFLIDSKGETKLNQYSSTADANSYYGRNGFIVTERAKEVTVDDYKQFVYMWRLMYKEISNMIREYKAARKDSYFTERGAKTLGWQDRCYLDMKLHYIRTVARELMLLRMEKKEKFKQLLAEMKKD